MLLCYTNVNLPSGCSEVLWMVNGSGFLQGLSKALQRETLVVVSTDCIEDMAHYYVLHHD